MKFHLVTPTEEVVSTQIDSVILPGKVGEMEILPEHTPLISLLREGSVTYRYQGTSTKYNVGNGHVEVADDQVTCLVESATVV